MKTGIGKQLEQVEECFGKVLRKEESAQFGLAIAAVSRESCRIISVALKYQERTGAKIPAEVVHFMEGK